MAAHAEGKSDPFCKYDDHLLQLFTSSLFLAAAAAAMVGSWTCNRFGRKMTMLAGGACFLVGTGLVAGAVATGMLVVGRIVLGIGVGFACQATPLYLSEMAPHSKRGSLNIMFQLAVTLGRGRFRFCWVRGLGIQGEGRAERLLPSIQLSPAQRTRGTKHKHETQNANNLQHQQTNTTTQQRYAQASSARS